MAIFPVVLDDVEIFTTLINPTRQYSSSSIGITGSIKLFPRGSTIEKEIVPLSAFQESFINDNDLESLRTSIVETARTLSPGSSFRFPLESYFDAVKSQSSSARKKKKIEIARFTPGVSLTKEMVKKWNVKDILAEHYFFQQPSAIWGYTNYNALNFFTSPAVLTSSVLLYPNVSNAGVEALGIVSGTYSLTGAFSFDFRINPRYSKDLIDQGHFKAGTIFHLSSSYALSLVTGSVKDENGLPLSFRVQLQLSHSADIPPSQAIPGTYPNDLIFLSDDNVIKRNEWHRVVVRWGTSAINDGTGSFNINGVDHGKFVVPSASIAPLAFSGKSNPGVLCLGNYYEGTNTGNSSQLYFFSDVVAEREGLQQLTDTGGMYDEPFSYKFNHPLKAELHNTVIHRSYLSNNTILQTSSTMKFDINSSSLAFYVPPFFVEPTPIRKFVGTHGGVLQTPFFEINGSTNDPFNVAMAFGVNGHYINLENFVKDFANEVFPRLHHLSASVIDYTTDAKPANEFLYQQKSTKKRNLSILPCDDGNFFPDFSILANFAGKKSKNKFGKVDLSFISLDDLLSTASLLFGKTHDAEYDETLSEQQIGFTPEKPSSSPGAAILNKKKYIESIITTDEGEYGPGVAKNIPLTIYQRTKDPSSNQVTFFDISNLYFGSRILPGSFEITDTSITGSGGSISITLRDDGFGNLYRADSSTPHSKWNSVGSIFYNEGVVVIKSPHLYFFGQEQFDMKFKGEHQLHTSKYEILAPAGMLNSSSNSSYAKVENEISASKDILDTDLFVYISSINFHDENLNVIAKANLAQPVLKREGEKILFKVGFDF